MKTILKNPIKRIHAYSFHIIFSFLIAGVGCNSKQSVDEMADPVMTAEETTNHPQQINRLTENEKKDGWKLLFNGIDLDGWTSVGKDQPPSTGWKVENGILTKIGNERGGDIITINEYSDFELSFEFKITKGANSGIKYFFTNYNEGGWLGFEFQILDDENHPDAKLGRNGNRLQGTLYDMFPLEKEQKNLTGQWVHAKIIAKGTNVEHYLNGEKVLSFDRNSDSFNKAWKVSKYKDSKPQFGKVEKGHILLQDHGDEVFFKNIKIKTL